MQLQLKLGGVGTSSASPSAASIKQRLGSYREWLLKQCLNCATRLRQWRPHKKGSRSRRKSLSSNDNHEGDEPPQQYWGPLIGDGVNGPSAKPLFSTFR